MNSRAVSRLTITIAAIVVGFTTYAQAGPPLICHRIEIGQASSLPVLDWNRKDTAGTRYIKRRHPYLFVRFERRCRQRLYNMFTGGGLLRWGSGGFGSSRRGIGLSWSSQAG